MTNNTLITEQYRNNYRIAPSCPTARTGCCSNTGVNGLAAYNAKGVGPSQGIYVAVTALTDVRVWASSRSRNAGLPSFTPQQWVDDQRCDYKNLCMLKNTLLKRYLNANNITSSGEVLALHNFIKNQIDEKICLSSSTQTTITATDIIGGCIDPDADNFCGTCNADCSNVSSGTDTHCCRYNEEYSLKYTYRFCDKSEGVCKGGEGTTLKADELYKLRYRNNRTIRDIIKQLKDKIGDLLIKTNILSPYNLVEYGFFSDVSISDSDLEDFATALTIILFGNAAIDNRLKYLDGGDILEGSNTFKYSHVTIYSAGAGQLYLGNYKIISPNTQAISSRIENLINDTTIDIIKNQLNWLSKNNKSISDSVPTYKMVDGEKVWSVKPDIGKNIARTRKLINKYMPGQYIISDTGDVLRESIIGLEKLLIEEPTGLGKLLK